MSRRVQENLVAVIVLLFFVGVIVMGQQYGPRARLVPTIVASLGVIFMVVQLVYQNLRSQASLSVDLLEMISARATGDTEALPDEVRSRIERKAAADRAREERKSSGGRLPEDRVLRELWAIFLVVLAVGMFLVIGPMPTMLIYTLGYFIISGHFKISHAVVTSIVFTILVYLLFYYWLRVDMRKGIIDLNFGLW